MICRSDKSGFAWNHENCGFGAAPGILRGNCPEGLEVVVEYRSMVKRAGVVRRSQEAIELILVHARGEYISQIMYSSDSPFRIGPCDSLLGCAGVAANGQG